MSIRQVDSASPDDKQSRTLRKIPGAGANARQGTADECHEAMLRHNKHLRQTAPLIRVEPCRAQTSGGGNGTNDEPGDIIYGAESIAWFIFDDCDAVGPTRARRRVYHLWNHYRDRKERAGFFKLKGTLCLSKSQWRRFHGLD